MSHDKSVSSISSQGLSSADYPVEINLYDIVHLFVKRARVFCWVAVVAAVIGLGFVWLKPATYQFNYVLRVPSYQSGSSFDMVVSSSQFQRYLQQLLKQLPYYNKLKARIDPNPPGGKTLPLIIDNGQIQLQVTGDLASQAKHQKWVKTIQQNLNSIFMPRVEAYRQHTLQQQNLVKQQLLLFKQEQKTHSNIMDLSYAHTLSSLMSSELNNALALKTLTGVKLLRKEVLSLPRHRVRYTAVVLLLALMLGFIVVLCLQFLSGYRRYTMQLQEEDV